MNRPLVEALAPLLERLLALAEKDPDLRTDLHRLGEALLAVTEGQAVTTESATAAISEPVPSSAAPPAPREEAPVPSAPVLFVSTLAARTEAAPRPTNWREWPTKADLPLVAARCRLKAEAARWAATRRGRSFDAANGRGESDPGYPDLIDRARKLPDCFLWMCHADGPYPSNPTLYQDVAACFEAAAEAAILVESILEDYENQQGEFEPALDLLAEAQSGLRAAIARLDGNADTDQAQLYNWLRTTAAEFHIFIRRHMRLDDPADPARCADLRGRIKAQTDRLDEGRKRVKQRKKLLGKIKHKASLLAASPSDAAEHWKILADTVDELVAGGLPPSNVELRNLLLPIIEDVPDPAGTPRGFQLALREIDRFLALTSVAETGPAVAEPSPTVRDAAQLLAGRSLVLIGGERRPAAHQALAKALGLRELIWIETREHQSIDEFAPYVARPDVAAVLLAIRWSSHSFGDVKDFCDRHDKPLVRLPGGYNPNQVATQIMAQCSGRLAELR